MSVLLSVNIGGLGLFGNHHQRLTITFIFTENILPVSYTFMGSCCIDSSAFSVILVQFSNMMAYYSRIVCNVQTYPTWESLQALRKHRKYIQYGRIQRTRGQKTLNNVKIECLFWQYKIQICRLQVKISPPGRIRFPLTQQDTLSKVASVAGSIIPLTPQQWNTVRVDTLLFNQHPVSEMLTAHSSNNKHTYTLDPYSECNILRTLRDWVAPLC